MTVSRTDVSCRPGQQWLSFWLARGRVADAVRCARERGLSAEDRLAYSREAEQIALVRLLIAEGRLESALRLSERLLAATQGAGRISRLIKVLVLQALAFQEQGDGDQAMDALERALSLAKPEGYLRTFADERLPMAALLRRARSQGIFPSYVGQILTASGQMPGSQPLVDESRVAQPVVDPLTAREIEILHLVAAGLRNQEIADRLVISPATVKRHLCNVYGKLGASNRTQAVARGRELGLLPPTS